MNEYRIKEYRDKFEIEVKTTKRVGCFRKKEIVSWEPIDKYGNPIYYTYHFGVVITNRHNRCKKFKTLKSARKGLKKILTEPKYHDHK